MIFMFVKKETYFIITFDYTLDTYTNTVSNDIQDDNKIFDAPLRTSTVTMAFCRLFSSR